MITKAPVLVVTFCLCLVWAASAAINPDPSLRVIQFCIEEPFSALFSFLLVLTNLYLYRELNKAALTTRDEDYPYIYCWKLQVYFWTWSYIWSTLFHIHENKLTERMDYFGAVIGKLILIKNSVLTFKLY
eukprot:TRINITY_DN2816_c0_g1_i2.p2 TRINITY_DN2816_c0_g1~~TRINITY_DN2816_c0_g1_i2.p2  ORF type:complete len:130 (+),score=12.43 TRINITY_DN2816_c0_g1_i2:44-433(+)